MEIISIRMQDNRTWLTIAEMFDKLLVQLANNGLLDYNNVGKREESNIHEINSSYQFN